MTKIGLYPVRTWGLLQVLRSYWGRIAVGAALALVATVLGLAQPLVVKQIIDAAGVGIATSVMVLVGLFATQAVVDSASRYVLACGGERIVLGLRTSLIDHLLRLRMQVYDEQRIGDLLSRVSTDAAAARHALVNGVANMVTAAIGVVGAAVLMVWLDWVLFATVAGLVAVGLLILVPVLRGIRAAALRYQEATGALTSDMERALSAGRTVRANRAEDREVECLTGHARTAYRAGLRLARLETVVEPASQLAVGGSFLAVLVIGGMRVEVGDSSIAELVAFLLYLLYLIGPIGAVFEAASAVQQAGAALDRINQVLRLPREGDQFPDTPESVHSVPDTAAVASAPVLELCEVWFGYDPQRPVLRGVSFEVPRRGHVALVGRSGVGKSTIFALIEQFYEPDRGRIVFNGRDVRAMGRARLRADIGLVEQHCPIMQGTLRDNLTYAVPQATDGEIDRVTELANLTELIAGLPHGLDAMIGDHGMTLSGGERQRLAIARALLSRPRLLLLDEPTAQLDTVNETALVRAIEQISTECAVLVAAHRHSTIRAADQIVVLDHGTTGVGTLPRDLAAGDIQPCPISIGERR